MAHCVLHQGDFEKAKVTHMEIIISRNNDNISKHISLYLAFANHYVQMIEEADMAVSNGLDGWIKNCVLLHLDLKRSEHDD